ncbi:MAG TPA: hypothetical protein DCZ92_05320 [Elusimicrobia bacterium]|nr:hypothetical protein [Elusimicrobiota bacterium]
MKKNLMIALLLAASAATAFAADIPAVSAPAPAAPARDPLAGGEAAFSDPVFQDFVETADGYLNSKNTPKLRDDFRDAPGPLAAPSLKAPFPARPAMSAAAMIVPAPSQITGALPASARDNASGPRISHYKVTFAGEAGPMGSHVWPLDSTPGNYAREYAFFSVTPYADDYNKLLSKLESEVGFKFIGEKTYHARNSKKTIIMGWAPYASIGRILKMKGVAKASVEKRSTGVPLKTKVRITLKVPFQNKPNAFVPDFIKTMSEKNEFTAENWFRLPQHSPNSRFSVFDVTGILPVDMVGEVSRSPFVSSIEFKDSSL